MVRIFSKKIFGYPIRGYQLYRFLRKQDIDITISQSSFHSPLTAWLLKTPNISRIKNNKIDKYF